MIMDQVNRVEQLADISTLGAGAAAEKFATALKAVLENVRDPNTEAEARRKVVLTWEFVPEPDRERVKVMISARTALAGTKPVSEVLYIGKLDGQTVGTVVHGVPIPEDPRQGVLSIESKTAGGAS